MSDSSVSATELTSQYLAQVTSDLEHNTKERERISGEITALQEQLAALQHDFAVLQNMHQALQGASAADEARAATEQVTPENTSEAVVVPAPRTAGSRKPAASKRTRATTAKSTKSARTAKTAKATKTAGAAEAATRGTATATRGTAKKQAAKKSAARTPAGGGAPKLVDLVRQHLTEQNEPRSAAEIAEALGKAHPERSIKTTVVRTTLESLVARNHAQRSKQGTSVFYTASEAAPVTTGADTKAAEQEARQES
ncbi:hypothetical protein AB0E88_33510 [Streptomyces sp. NPDC028635]|uniref:hypothetical protein n=1 Tax=Streptomyces sp. NPDC028635 TaxID=3154800 RepID=UPI0033EAC419